MYQRTNESDKWNNSSNIIIGNNSVILPKDVLGSQYGIVCASFGAGNNASITWYYPSGKPVTSDFTNATYRIFVSNIGSELRKSGNMRQNDSGIHTCVLNNSITVHRLYLALNFRSQNFETVELTALIKVEINSVGILVANCTSTGLPAEEVDWLLDDTIVSAGKRRQAITDRVTIVYSNFLILEHSDLALNESECLRCQVRANGTHGNSSCMKTNKIGEFKIVYCHSNPLNSSEKFLFKFCIYFRSWK